MTPPTTLPAGTIVQLPGVGAYMLTAPTEVREFIPGPIAGGPIESFKLRLVRQPGTASPTTAQVMPMVGPVMLRMRSATVASVSEFERARLDRKESWTPEEALRAALLDMPKLSATAVVVLVYGPDFDTPDSSTTYQYNGGSAHDRITALGIMEMAKWHLIAEGKEGV